MNLLFRKYQKLKTQKLNSNSQQKTRTESSHPKSDADSAEKNHTNISKNNYRKTITTLESSPWALFFSNKENPQYLQIKADDGNYYRM